MKTGIPLIIKDRKIFQRFRERTISDYDEYKFVSGMNIYDRAGIDMSYCLTKEHEK
jgi:hypothetical protein